MDRRRWVARRRRRDAAHRLVGEELPIAPGAPLARRRGTGPRGAAARRAIARGTRAALQHLLKLSPRTPQLEVVLPTRPLPSRGLRGTVVDAEGESSPSRCPTAGREAAAARAARRRARPWPPTLRVALPPLVVASSGPPAPCEPRNPPLSSRTFSSGRSNLVGVRRERTLVAEPPARLLVGRQLQLGRHDRSPCPRLRVALPPLG